MVASSNLQERKTSIHKFPLLKLARGLLTFPQLQEPFLQDALRGCCWEIGHRASRRNTSLCPDDRSLARRCIPARRSSTLAKKASISGTIQTVKSSSQYMRAILRTRKQTKMYLHRPAFLCCHSTQIPITPRLRHFVSTVPLLFSSVFLWHLKKEYGSKLERILFSRARSSIGKREN